MRIGINARILISPKIRGWSRYTANLVSRELSWQGIDLILYSHEEIDPVFTRNLRPGSYTVRVSPRMPYLLWEERWLPRQCSADCVSVLHSPFNFGLPFASVCPTVLTLHDAMFKLGSNGFTFERRAWESRLYHWIARSRASRIVTVTEFAKRDLVNAFGIAPDRISVTHEGADPAFTVRPPPRLRFTPFGASTDLTSRTYFTSVVGSNTRTSPFSSMHSAMVQSAASISSLVADYHTSWIRSRRLRRPMCDCWLALR